MEQNVLPHQGRLSALDQIMPPSYIRFSLAFRIHDATAAINQLKAGAELLGSKVPFLLGHVGLGGRPEEAKACLEILPHVGVDNPSIITHIRYLSASYSEVFPTGHAPCKAVADPSHLPLSFLADPTAPAPILRLQAIVLNDGIILGFAVHHGVCDGTGLGIILREFGACCRAAEADDPNPLSVGITSEVQLSTRALLDQCTAPRRGVEEEDDYKDSFVSNSASSQPAGGLGSAMGGPRGPVSTRTFLLQGTKLQGLKSKLNQMIKTHPCLQKAYADVPWVSTNDIVMALAWISFNRARRLVNGESPGNYDDSDNGVQKPAGGISFSVNIRNRIEPVLPSSFLGNACLPVRQPLPHLCPNSEQLTENRQAEWYLSLCHIALSLRRKLNSMNDTKVRGTLSYLNAPMAPKTIAYNSSDIVFTSWRDMGTYNVDFGDEMGYPLDMRVEEMSVRGIFVVLPQRRTSTETWELQATADSDTMKHLREDTFGGVVSI